MTVEPRLRIALYHNLPSGGAKRTVLDAVRRLARRHHVDEYCPATADRSFCDVGPHVGETVVFPYRRGRLFRSPLGRLNSAVRLVDLLRLEAVSRRAAAAIDRRGYDVALVEPCMVTQAPSVLAYLRTPSVYYCQETLRAVHEPAIPRPYRRATTGRALAEKVDPLARALRVAVGRLDRRNARAARLVLANSHYSRESIRRAYGLAARVCYPGVDSEAFHPLGGPRGPAVLSVGAITPEKGFDFVIDSLATLPARARPPLTVVANAGNPEEQAYLAALAQRLGVAVAFRPGVSDDELVRLYGEAALTVYAPVREPLGLVPLESQACGTPVVGVAEGGVSETVIHERTGLLVERDPAAFGHAISCLLASPARLERYGEAGRAHVARDWCWEASAGQLAESLAQAAAPGPGREVVGR